MSLLHTAKLLNTTTTASRMILMDGLVHLPWSDTYCMKCNTTVPTKELVTLSLHKTDCTPSENHHLIPFEVTPIKNNAI